MCTGNPNTCEYAEPTPGLPDVPECSIIHEECCESTSAEATKRLSSAMITKGAME